MQKDFLPSNFTCTTLSDYAILNSAWLTEEFDKILRHRTPITNRIKSMKRNPSSKFRPFPLPMKKQGWRSRRKFCLLGRNVTNICGKGMWDSEPYKVLRRGIGYLWLTRSATATNARHHWFLWISFTTADSVRSVRYFWNYVVLCYFVDYYHDRFLQWALEPFGHSDNIRVVKAPFVCSFNTYLELSPDSRAGACWEVSKAVYNINRQTDRDGLQKEPCTGHLPTTYSLKNCSLSHLK